MILMLAHSPFCIALHVRDLDEPNSAHFGMIPSGVVPHTQNCLQGDAEEFLSNLELKLSVTAVSGREQLSMSKKIEIVVAGASVSDELLIDLVRHTFNEPQEEFCVPCIFRKHGSLAEQFSLDDGLDTALQSLPLPKDWKVRLQLPKSKCTYYTALVDVECRQEQYQIAVVARGDCLPDSRVVILQPGASYPFFVKPISANSGGDDSEALHMLLARAFEETARANVALEVQTTRRSAAEDRIRELEALLEKAELQSRSLEEKLSRQQTERQNQEKSAREPMQQQRFIGRGDKEAVMQQRMIQAEEQAKLVVEQASARHAQAAQLLVVQGV